MIGFSPHGESLSCIIKRIPRTWLKKEIIAGRAWELITKYKFYLCNC